MTAAASWARSSERGNWFSYALIYVARHLGGWAGVRFLLLRPTALYFTLFSKRARRASGEYLSALGIRPSLRTCFHHLLAFARNILDRMMLWAGERERFVIDHRGGERLLELAREKRGAILMGAHVGSFDMLRLVASQYELVVNVVMFTAHAAAINGFFASLDPKSKVRVLQLDPSSVSTAFAIRACLERGEFVGILADRVHAGERERPVELDFLGRRTVFPLSPFLLAAALGAETLVSLCVATGRGRYFAFVEQLLPEGRVPRAERDQKARAMLEGYVQTLEDTCRRSPYQWFNFYDYWHERATA